MLAADLTVELIDPAGADARKLIAALDACQAPMYPPASNHLDSPEELSKAHVRFVGALHQGELLGCGALKLFTDYGEIKRMYVPPHARGSGVAKALIAALEGFALNASVASVKLETGIYQLAAIGLYEKLGYLHCGPFGDYIVDPMSVFMEKKLVE